MALIGRGGFRVEHLLGVHKALGFIPSIRERKEEPLSGTAGMPVQACDPRNRG